MPSAELPGTVFSIPAMGGQPVLEAVMPRTRLVSTELAFLRFAAGLRALLAALMGLILLPVAHSREGRELVVLVPYLAWSALLLWKTLDRWPRAASRLWLWVDAAVLLVTSQLLVNTLPLFGISTVLPVVALAVQNGTIPALVLSLVCSASMLWLAATPAIFGGLAPIPVIVPFIVLALGPAAALLLRPCRELRQRLSMIDTINQQADPRQGLCN